jgi:hypothetical protein
VLNRPAARVGAGPWWAVSIGVVFDCQGASNHDSGRRARGLEGEDRELLGAVNLTHAAGSKGVLIVLRAAGREAALEAEDQVLAVSGCCFSFMFQA